MSMSYLTDTDNSLLYILASSETSSTEKIPPPAYTTELFHNFEGSNSKNTKYTNFVSALDHLFFFHNNDLYTLDKDGEVTPITGGGGGGEDTSASIWTNFGESDSSYAVLNDMLYMFVGDDENNVQLFKTDGTNQGTMKVRCCLRFFVVLGYICYECLMSLLS